MHKVGLILYPNFSPMNFAATSVFETANWRLGSAEYEVTLLSEHGGHVATSLGYEIQTSSFKRRTFDTLIVAGSVVPPGGDSGTPILPSIRCSSDQADSFHLYRCARSGRGRIAQ